MMLINNKNTYERINLTRKVNIYDKGSRLIIYKASMNVKRQKSS